MNTVYYGVKTNNYEEDALINLLKNGVSLLVIPWNDFKKHTNDLILLNSIVVLSSGIKDFWENITFQMRQVRCKYYCFLVPEEFYDLAHDQVRLQLTELVANLPASAYISLIVPLTGNFMHWEFWNNIKMENVHVMLYLSQEVDEDIITRWSTEPISSIMLPAAKFVHEYELPVLPDYLQAMLRRFISRTPPAIIIASDKDQTTYIKGIKWLISKIEIDPASDILIDPLQPLKDNLSLGIYEVFETDTVKYEQYEKAIFRALKDIDLLCVKILIIGPGRGPLIDILLRVIKELKCEYRIDAVEKNPNCYVVLQERNHIEWKEKINLMNEDVRIRKHTNYNLVISELLGSFGCNEVCPEILQDFTDENTIMIPQSYENYLQPIYSPLLSSLKNEQLERPYLIKLNLFYIMSGIQPIWKFIHPTRANNSRSRAINFQVPHKGKVNALQGFFIANLYGSTQIGIHPQLAEGFCNSWYPFLFPILEIVCNDNSILSFQIERICNNKVWYEWSVNNKVYNKHGLYYSIGL